MCWSKKNEGRLLTIVNKIRNNWIWFLIFIIGVLLRFSFLTEYPLGVNQDEAFAGYEAYALLKEGVDAHGYINPIYFIAWGSGMNVLYSYLSIPAIACGGLSLFTVRFTQAFLGCIILVVFYLLLREMWEKKYALLGFFVFAITPWHIMLSRWGLESNVAPEMLIIAVYFLIKAYKGNSKYYILSFLFWGLCLYAYAIMWVFVPIVLIAFGVYGLRQRVIRMDRYLISGIGILGILGFPLLLFVAVNNGWIPEIRTNILSIPKLVAFRDSEVSLRLLWYKFGVMLKLLITQKSKYDTFNNTSVGIYYYCSIPFIILGFIASVRAFACNWKKRNYDVRDMLVLWFAAAFVVGCLISYGNVNKLNCIHVPMIFFGIRGMIILSQRRKNIWKPIAAIYIVSLCLFIKDYFVKEPSFKYYKYEDALEYAQNHTDGDIATILIAPPCLLMETKMLPSDYLDTVDTFNYETVSKMGRYQFLYEPQKMQPDVLYVIGAIYLDWYLQDGYEVLYENGNYYVIGNTSVFGDEE